MTIERGYLFEIAQRGHHSELIMPSDIDYSHS